MVVFRITHTKWAEALTGSGYPARWNSKGNHVIYTAESRALACLENLVHRSGEGLHKNFSLTEIEIPDNASTKTVRVTELPFGWHKSSHYHICQEIGDDWLSSKESLLLKVPSSIIQGENNLLVNPNHSEFSNIKIIKILPFRLDSRLQA